MQKVTDWCQVCRSPKLQVGVLLPFGLFICVSCITPMAELVGLDSAAEDKGWESGWAEGWNSHCDEHCDEYHPIVGW